MESWSAFTQRDRFCQGVRVAMLTPPDKPELRAI
ncbi:hypothetical protein GYH30_054668 [Glycine max]|nr:hypothetical protein GYH30_054668 [Glycine max]